MNLALAQFRSFKRRKPSLKAHGKKAFWIWIAYQTIKGTLTTSLIWMPLIVAYWKG